MPVTEYRSDIEAKVSYAIDYAQLSDEQDEIIMDSIEVFEILAFGRYWTMPELIDEFGEKGANAIVARIKNEVEY